jgi:hypothetical protein
MSQTILSLAPHYTIPSSSLNPPCSSNLTKPYQTLQNLKNLTKPYHTLLNLKKLTKPYQTLSNLTKPYQTLPNLTKPYQTFIFVNMYFILNQWARCPPLLSYDTVLHLVSLKLVFLWHSNLIQIWTRSEHMALGITLMTKK